MRHSGVHLFLSDQKMKRWIPAILLLAVLNAHADFLKYHEDDEMVSYMDATSVTRSGREARMWTIDDYRKPQLDFEGRKPFLSVKSLWIFDCEKRMSDVLMAFYHAETMARGEEVHSGALDKRQWDTVTPGSVGELAFQVACRQPVAGKPKSSAPTPVK